MSIKLKNYCKIRKVLKEYFINLHELEEQFKEKKSSEMSYIYKSINKETFNLKENIKPYVNTFDFNIIKTHLIDDRGMANEEAINNQFIDLKKTSENIFNRFDINLKYHNEFITPIGLMPERWKTFKSIVVYTLTSDKFVSWLSVFLIILTIIISLFNISC